jgi:hypothetical protein
MGSPLKWKVSTTQGAQAMNNTTTITIDLAKDVFQVA